jgi:hypothetical protein
MWRELYGLVICGFGAPPAHLMLSQAHLDNRLPWVFSRIFNLRRPIRPVVKTDAAVLLRHFGNDAESMARNTRLTPGPGKENVLNIGGSWRRKLRAREMQPAALRQDQEQLQEYCPSRL